MNPFASSCRRRPWWMRFAMEFVGAIDHKRRWFAWAPYIYPTTAFWDQQNWPGWTPLAAHQAHHINQQVMVGKFKWLWRYLTSSRFRLEQEAEAIAVELDCISSQEERRWRMTDYAHDLAGPLYRKCALTVYEARMAIMDAASNLNLTI